MRGGDWLHIAVIAALAAGFAALPDYHAGVLARVMVLAVFAMGYNILFGYTGLLSLGHALFFAAGMYGLALLMRHADWAAGPALIAGIVAGAALAALIGALALRTVGVAFMIVTLMFAQAGYLTILYFGEWTRGDEGFVIPQAARTLFGVDLSDGTNRYFAALILFGAVLLATGRLVDSPLGRALVAIRENEARAEMLGYNTARLKLIAVTASGAISAAAGASYALFFGYAGASFAAVPYSILPLLYVLLGGAGTTLGPLIGTVLMFYLIDISSGYTDAYMLVAGVVLVGLTLFAREGIGGLIRAKIWARLP